MARSSYIKDSSEQRGFDIVHTAKCLGVSYILSVVLLFILAICATVWDMEAGAVNICVTVITGISVLFCGFTSARGAGRGGLINGIIAGVLYTLLLYAVGSIVSGSIGFNAATISALLVGVFCGGLGGVLGINTKRRRR